MKQKYNIEIVKEIKGFNICQMNAKNNVQSVQNDIYFEYKTFLFAFLSYF